MKTETLTQLIDDENKARQEQTLARARTIITNIGREQEVIAEANKRISEFRKQLQELEAPSVDASKILG